VTCEPGAPIHAEELHATDQVKIWWGEAPQPPMEDWIYYDDGNYSDAIGTGGSTVYWAAMFPANSISGYAGTNLTKVAMYEDPTLNIDAITTYIYLGGNNTPGTLVSTQTFNPTGAEGFHEVTLNTPVGIDGTQNLWIVFSEYGTYPATGCANTGDANGRWISTDGVEWDDVATYGLDYTWMIRGFVTNQAKGGMVENIALAPITPASVETSHMTLGRSGREQITPADLSFMNRSSIVNYNVYRSDDNDEYALVGTVPAVEGQTYYEYIDTPASAGTYYYMVKAEYSDGCESDGAPAFDNPDQDYVTANVDAIGENDGNVALYPNPTSGNVTIEAAGMSRITVVSVLGQVVFDTELNADNYTLNMAQFNAGMYMVRIYSENGVTVKRVTVMK
ncbi:MAG: T9SS type A sorting domain-containing protein, partial [Bacteroidales bacterium]|nr:T9SS type A sorting domain-containing protein [Bacteroidales bacterium]